jgi:hypothetical protein
MLYDEIHFLVRPMTDKAAVFAGVEGVKFNYKTVGLDSPTVLFVNRNYDNIKIVLNVLTDTRITLL